MGKRIIVKGADFSTNAIKEYALIWHFTELSEGNPQGAGVFSSGGFMSNIPWSGQVVNRIRFKLRRAGTLTIGKVNSRGTTTITDQQVLNVAGNQGDIVTLEINDITINEGEYLVFGIKNDTASFFYSDSLVKYQFVGQRGQAGTQAWSDVSLCVDYGYYGLV